MSDAVLRSEEWAADRRSSAPIAQATLCAISLIAYASLSLWMLYGAQATAPGRSVVPTLAPARIVSISPAPARSAPLRFAQAFAQASETAHPVIAPAARITGLLDPGFTGRYAPSPFHGAPPPQAMLETPSTAPTVEARLVPEPPEDVADVPLPLPRPTFALPEGKPSIGSRTAGLLPPPVETAETQTPAKQPGFFEKMFGARPDGPAMAYAPEDGGLPGLLGRPASPDRYTAVYNIAKHTVTLPDGRQLEAHSGLGARLDDPRSVNEHMRGVTPTTLYELTPRESLFHGVRALRLTPLDPDATHGRLGLLAHTFMLGPRGDSNGCVVFRDYASFLQAYESGAIRRLVVVAGV